MNEKPKILIFSDNVLINTGMAVVVRNIALNLHALNKYSVCVGGWGYAGEPHQFPLKLYPMSSADFGKAGHENIGIPSLERLIDQISPQIVISLGDSWMINYVNDLPNRKKFKHISYMPIDGDPIPQYWIPWLKGPDQLVLYSKYGVDELKKVAPEIHPEMIYHGCQPHIYKPLSDDQRKDIRKKIMFWKVQGNQIVQGQGVPEDAFIVGSFSRNQPRKNFDKTIKAFSLFAKDKPNARLWLHSAIQDAAYNLADLAKVFGIEDKTYFTPGYNLVNGLSEENLNYLMNILDVHLLPCQGEGWGLTILETMSAGIPQIVTDYTAHVEFSAPCAELIPLKGRPQHICGVMGETGFKKDVVIDPMCAYDNMITGIPHCVERAIPDVSEIIKCMNKLYFNESYRLQLAKNAREIACGLTWDVTTPKWSAVIDNVLAGKTNSNSVTGPSLGNEIVSQKKSAIEIVRI